MVQPPHNRHESNILTHERVPPSSQLALNLVHKNVYLQNCQRKQQQTIRKLDGPPSRRHSTPDAPTFPRTRVEKIRETPLGARCGSSQGIKSRANGPSLLGRISREARSYEVGIWHGYRQVEGERCWR